MKNDQNELKLCVWYFLWWTPKCAEIHRNRRWAGINVSELAWNDPIPKQVYSLNNRVAKHPNTIIKAHSSLSTIVYPTYGWMWRKIMYVTNP